MLVKNINSTHRIEGVSTQYGLSGALKAAKVRLGQHDEKVGDEGSNDLKSEGFQGLNLDLPTLNSAAATAISDNDKHISGDILSI